MHTGTSAPGQESIRDQYLHFLVEVVTDFPRLKGRVREKELEKMNQICSSVYSAVKYRWSWNPLASNAVKFKIWHTSHSTQHRVRTLKSIHYCGFESAESVWWCSHLSSFSLFFSGYSSKLSRAFFRSSLACLPELASHGISVTLFFVKVFILGFSSI